MEGTPSNAKLVTESSDADTTRSTYAAKAHEEELKSLTSFREERDGGPAWRLTARLVRDKMQNCPRRGFSTALTSHGSSHSILSHRSKGVWKLGQVEVLTTWRGSTHSI